MNIPVMFGKKISTRLGVTTLTSTGAFLLSTALFADGLDPVEISDASAAAMVSQSLALGGSFGSGAYAITPSWSEELGASVTGSVGAELDEGSAVGLILTAGERKREALINFAMTIDDSRQIILSAGQLQEKLEFGTAGEQEWVKQSEFGLAYDASNYSFNAYHVDSETTANFSGSTATALEMGGSVELSSVTNLDYTAGYQKLDWDDGSASDTGLTASVDLVHQLDADMVLNVSASHSVSANTYGIGATWNLGDATLSASYNYLDTLVGSGLDDRSVSLTFNVPFGSTRTSSGNAVVSSSGLAQRNPNILAEVMKRPTFLPQRVIAKPATSSSSSDSADCALTASGIGAAGEITPVGTDSYAQIAFKTGVDAYDQAVTLPAELASATMTINSGPSIDLMDSSGIELTNIDGMTLNLNQGGVWSEGDTVSVTVTFNAGGCYTGTGTATVLVLPPPPPA